MWCFTTGPLRGEKSFKLILVSIRAFFFKHLMITSVHKFISESPFLSPSGRGKLEICPKEAFF